MTDTVAKIVEDIRRGDPISIESYITTVEHAYNIQDTKTAFYSHMLAANGNGEPRLADFIEFIARHIIEYVIPRSRILEANAKDDSSKSSTHISRLYMEARSLFTPLEKTGEGGEMLLFILGEVLLQLPQLFCKMSVKTAGGVHFHGADGIHVGVDNKGGLELYWGESKFHTTFESAISECLDSVSPILKRENKSDLEDLLLLQSHLDLGSDKHTDALKFILNKDNKEFNSVKYCGLCLIGFNHDLYTPETTAEIIKTQFEEWKSSLTTRLKNRKLEKFDIHFFCLPIRCVDTFRNEFLTCMGIKK